MGTLGGPGNIIIQDPEKEKEMDEKRKKRTERQEIISAARRPLMGMLGFAMAGAAIGMIAFWLIVPLWITSSRDISELQKRVRKQAVATKALDKRVGLQERRDRVVVDRALADRLNARFAGTDLDGMGEKMVVEAGAYGIDPRVLAGVAAVETGGKNIGPAGIFGGSDPGRSPAGQIEEYCGWLYDAYGPVQRGWQIDTYSGAPYGIQWVEMVEQVRLSI